MRAVSEGALELEDELEEELELALEDELDDEVDELDDVDEVLEDELTEETADELDEELESPPPPPQALSNMSNANPEALLASVCMVILWLFSCQRRVCGHCRGER